jgi:hypothetical protein
MEMVIWDAVVEHVLRITRVLKRHRGCLILSGFGGTGRESIVRSLPIKISMPALHACQHRFSQ